MFKSKLTWVSVLALVLAIFVPMQTASATTSITKTITVHGVTGAAYSGALVSYVSFDDVNQIYWTTPGQTTNNAGVATVTLSDAIHYIGFVVEPPVSDTATAIYSYNHDISKFDETVSVNLSAANMRVKILNPDGSDAPAGSTIAHPPVNGWGGLSWEYTARSGSFGINVDPSTPAGDYQFAIGDVTDIDQYNRFFAFRLAGSGASASKTLYTDDTFTTPMQATGGVYALTLYGATLHGWLRSATGASLTLPAGVQGHIAFSPSNSDGTIDANNHGPKSTAFQSNGSFSATLPTMKPGKYFSHVLLSGSELYPSFEGPAIWVDSQGRFATSVNGTYQSPAAFSLQVNLPAQAPNLVFRTLNSAGEATAAYVDVFGRPYDWWGASATTNGIAAYVLPVGEYDLDTFLINSSEILSDTYFSVVVSDSGVVVSDDHQTIVRPNSDGSYSARAVVPNVHFLVIDPADHSKYLASSNVTVSTKNPGPGDNFSIGNYSINGQIDLSVPDGDYVLRVYPGGDSPYADGVYNLTVVGSTVTVTDSNNVAVPQAGGAFVVHPALANLMLNITDPTTAQPLTFSFLNVLNIDDSRNVTSFVDNTNAPTGLAGINLPDGHYELDVYANFASNFAMNRYELTLSENGATVILKDWLGTVINSQTDGSFNISPAAPNVAMRITDPVNSSKILSGSYVNVQNSSGQWLPGSGTNPQGKAFLNLPAGDYSLEVQPGGSSSTLASNKYNLHVDSSGVASIANSRAETILPDSNGFFNLVPSQANLRVNIVSPDDQTQILDQSYVTVWSSIGDSRINWITGSGGQGRPGFNLPDGSYQLQIDPGAGGTLATKYYKVSISNSVATVTTMDNQAATVDANGSYLLSPSRANLIIQIVDPSNSSTVLQNAYVNVNDLQGLWVAGTGSNRGVVSLNVPDGEYTVEVNPGGGGTGLAAKKYRLTVSGGTATIQGLTAVNGKIIAPVASANVLIKVISPNDATKVMLNASVNVTNSSDGSYVTGMGGNTGRLNLRVDDGIYNLQVDPHDNSTEKLAVKNYTLTVTQDGSSVDIAGQSAGSNGLFNLVVSNPSIIGQVTMPANGASVSVPNSWVVPTDSATNNQLWQLGSSSDVNGRFGLAVPDGSYSVSAEVPWNSGYELARSAACEVSVVAGQVTNAAGGCVQSDKSIALSLRSPNVSFVVVGADGHTPVPNANVSLQYGSWNIWATANSAGKVSLFVDPAQIQSSNRLGNGVTVHLRATIDPPYGDSSLVRTECTQGDNSVGTICSKLNAVVTGTTYTSQAMGTVQMATPNTRVTVTLPNGTTSIGAGAWIALFKEQPGCGNCRSWVSGGVTDKNGVASFNLSDADKTGTFDVEVNAPYDKRNTYSQKLNKGLTYSDLATSTVSLGTPNLSLTVKQPNGQDADKWAGIGLEQVDPVSLNPIQWVAGYGTDEQGRVNMTVPGDGTFRVTANPGFGSSGVRTTCIINSSASGVISLGQSGCEGMSLVGQSLSMNLALGNVTGTVSYRTSHGSTQTKALAGAIVYAEPVNSDGTIRAGDTQQFTTGASGQYGLLLSPGIWRIKTFFVNADGTAPTVLQNSSGDIVTVGSTLVKSIVLDVQ